MRLIRMLAALTMIIAGLAVPAPASAMEFKPGPPPDQQALKGICDLFAGTYTEEERLSYTCELRDTPIICVVDREQRLCSYEAIASLWPPPIKEDCEGAGGSLLTEALGVAVCELKQGILTLDCWFDPKEPDAPTPCDLGWIPSEQPMT